MYGVRQFKNKITIFYFLEYNLFNQPTQKSLYGDLSITGLVGDSLERQALSIKQYGFVTMITCAKRV
jgi:hypothetical protein